MSRRRWRVRRHIHRRERSDRLPPKLMAASLAPDDEQSVAASGHGVISQVFLADVALRSHVVADLTGDPERAQRVRSKWAEVRAPRPRARIPKQRSGP